MSQILRKNVQLLVCMKEPTFTTKESVGSNRNCTVPACFMKLRRTSFGCIGLRLNGAHGKGIEEMSELTLVTEPTLKGEQLEKVVLENVNKLFEEDSKHLVDDYVKKVPKGKDAA